MENSNKKQLPAFAVLAIIALVAALVLALTNAVTAGPIAQHQQEALNAAFGAVMPLPDGGSYTQKTDGLDGYDVSSLYYAKDSNGNVLGYCVTASKKGYGGPVAVTLGVDADGKVTGCVIGDTNFAESAGFGTRALDESFREQFVGLDAVNGGTFEKLTGATVTSTAVKGAANEALRTISEVVLGKAVEGGDLLSFGAKAAPQVDTSALVPGGTMKGSAEGYSGEMVNVTIVLDDDCNIASIKVDASTQTPGIGQRCASDDGFLSSFVGMSLPVEVDVLSGATITSNAVMDAINGAEPAEAEAVAAMPVATVVAEDTNASLGLYDDGTAQVAANDSFTGTVTVEMQVVDGKVQGGTVMSAQPTAEPLPENALVASAAGFGGDPVNVVVTLNDDNTVATLKVDASTQAAGIGLVCEGDAFTNQFVGKAGPFSTDNIDVCAGATFTSKGVIEAVNSVLPAVAVAAPAEEAPAAEVVVDEPVAAIEELKATGEGFAEEPVTVYVTLNADGTVATLRVDASTQMAGIGLACEDASFTNQFVGKAGPFSTENIDVCAGATFTSKGVIEAVNKLVANTEATETVTADEPVAAETAAAPAEEAAPAAEELKATGEGFAEEPVTVYVTLNADGTVATLRVDASNQMNGIGLACEDASFTNQFVGKAGPFSTENIDVCAGATFTSKGVIEAVNKLLPAPAAVEAAAPAVEELKATGEGFAEEPVTVYVTLNADGTVATLRVDASNQMNGIGLVCQEDAFTNQFVGKAGPFSTDNIDVCTGATYTSKGVIEAVNKLLPAPAAEETAPAAEELKATGEGFAEEPVTVYVTLNADGTVATLRVDASNQMNGIGLACEDASFTNQFVGKAGPFSTDNIDVCAGATFTSKGVIEAVNKLLPAPAAEEAAAPAVEELKATGEGFAEEPVTVYVTLNADGTVATLRVDASNQMNGIGLACEEDAFTNQFVGKAGPFSTDNIDVCAGATFTSKGVIEAVNKLLSK